jgi:predicted MFS family arabinose efflux permease
MKDLPLVEPDDDRPVTSRWVVLGMLVVVYISSYLDRQILSILLPQIKAEFDVSDTALGLLTGLAFAVFYTTLGLPLARIADTRSRVNLLGICIAAWSLMTALCGAAGSYWQLLLARIGVGVGEAGCNPSAHSLIADYFPLSQRGRALAVYSTGVPLGSLLGLALGGWLGQQYGWRVAFLAVGLPGLLLAALVKFTLREPTRGYADQLEGRPAAPDRPPSLAATRRLLWRTRSFRWLCAFGAADAFVGYGILMWLPTYLVRRFDMSVAEVGLQLGLMIGIAGLAGTLGAGYFTDRLGTRNRRFYCWMPAIFAAISLVGNLGVYTRETQSATFVMLLIPLIALPAAGGPVYAAVQSVAPPRVRAMAAAVLLLVLNLVGLGLGPPFIGFLSDTLAARFGDESLRVAMLATTATYLVSAGAALMASRYFVADLEASDADIRGKPIE